MGYAPILKTLLRSFYIITRSTNLNNSNHLAWILQALQFSLL